MNTLLNELFDAYFKIDPAGRFANAQGKTVDLFNYPPDDLMGKNIWELFPDLAGGDLHQKIQAAAAQQQIMRASGSLLPNQGWLEVTIRPVEDGVECFVRDVSAYQQTRPGPTHDENGRIIFDALLDHIPEGIIIADASAPDGHFPFLIASRYAADILAIPRRTLLQYTLIDLIQAVDFIESETRLVTTVENHPLTRFIGGESAEDWEYILVNTRGEESTVSVKGGPVFNQDGQTIAGIFSWMDISARKQQEQKLEEYAERLEKSNNDLELFATTASHDLQEPLRKVKGFSEVLMKRYNQALEGEGVDLLERIYSGASRMQLLMADLLEFARVGIQEEDLAPVDLNATLSAVLNDLESSITLLEGSVEVAELPVVYANSFRMHQLFLNLLSNGIKFHRQDEAPHVRVYPTGQAEDGGQAWVQIAVEDNGIGFDVEELDRIIQPFQRLHSKREYEGSGMGLAICRRVLEQLGGQLSAVSSPGQGATFLVTLPRYLPDQQG